jgi:hypothetical protein
MPKFAQHPTETFEKVELSEIPAEGRSAFTLDQAVTYAWKRMTHPTEFDGQSGHAQQESHKARLKADLKNFDKRWQTSEHPNLAHNCLKSITEIVSPSGRRVQRDFLKGKIVGVLLFTDSERSLRFMRLLDKFTKEHSPDFVVVGISQGTREQMHITHRFGFHHLPLTSNSVVVVRDLGYMAGIFSPLPKLYIVDGMSGHCISPNGVAAVVARPSTAMRSWSEGFQGLEPLDYIKARFLL